MQREPWQTPEQAQWSADYKREMDRRHRMVVDAFKVWSFCPHKACRRGSACQNADPGACMRDFFDAMPESEKQYLRLVVKARSAGLSPEEADREARRRLDEHRQATTEPMPPAPPPEPVPPPAVRAKRAARPPQPPESEAARAARVRQAQAAEREGGALSRPGRGLSPAPRR